MANMTFKASLLPNTDLGYSLGSEDKRWKINNTFVFPVYYSNIDYSNTTPIAGAYTFNAQTHPVTGTIEYGSALSLPGAADGTAPYAAQLVISSASEQSSPVHAYIRRLTSTPLWSNWSTLLDNNNYTTYTVTKTGGGASGTWGISITGNAATATTASVADVARQCSSANLTNVAFSWSGSYTTGDWMLIHNGEKGTNGGELFRAINQANVATWVDAQHKWVRIGGDTMTGPLRINGTDNSSIDARLYIDHRSNNDWGIIIDKNNSYDYGMIVKCNSGGSHGIDVTGRITGTKVYGAVWNDYAEYRKTCNAKPGQCVVEISNGELKISNKRCLPAARVISDTFGFAIGETEECQTPIAVSGRVLVYIDNSNIKIGDAVCSGKNGTVSKMRWYERILYPERIVGVVSEIPDYDEWLAGERDGNHKIKVNGRIWIYVK